MTAEEKKKTRKENILVARAVKTSATTNCFLKNWEYSNISLSTEILSA